MANIISDSPLIIDTAAVTTISDFTFVCWMIRWVGAAVAGHLLIIKDKNNIERWASEAAGPNFVEESHFEKKPLIFEGLIVPQLDSGKVYIYILDQVPIKT